MPAVDCERYVTPSMVREIFQDYIIDNSNKGWGITVCGKILTVNGKMLFNSREQAVRAFYNSYHWRAMRCMHLAAHPNSDRWSWWNDESRTIYWKSFKKVLERDYGLKFIKL